MVLLSATSLDPGTEPDTDSSGAVLSIIEAAARKDLAALEVKRGVFRLLVLRFALVALLRFPPHVESNALATHSRSSRHPSRLQSCPGVEGRRKGRQ